MGKKKKVNKKKFFSRMFLLLALICIIIFVIKSLKKNETPKVSATIIVNGKNATENLSDDPYIDKDNILYLSLEDIKKIFDENIYYEENTKKVITTSGTKVAAINIENNTIELNTASIMLPVRSFKLW